MDWIQFLIIIISLLGMWISSRADWRRTEAKMDENRRETAEILRAIQQEMKDFHGRLCTIEEKNRR